MKIRCIHCGEYFLPDEETLELISDGYIYNHLLLILMMNVGK
jgi:hypothetical protein